MSLKRITLDIDGQKVHGYAKRGQNELWVHVQNRTFAVKLSSFTQKRGRAAGQADQAHSGEILAPMPGKIIKLSCKSGDTVKTGQSLIVMEAMKMEYSLKAPFDGIITLQEKKSGDQVVMGEKLGQIKKTT